MMPEIILVTAAVLFRRWTTADAFGVYAWMALLWNVVSCFRFGADMNYFLDLAVVGSISTGILWSSADRGCARDVGSVPGRALQFRPMAAAGQGQRAWRDVIFWTVYLAAASLSLLWAVVRLVDRLEVCQAFRAQTPLYVQYTDLVRLVRSPELRVLTDSPHLALKNYHEPPFVDPVLFRYLVDTGRIQPFELIAQIEDRQFDFILSTKQLVERDYDQYIFGYPRVVAAAVRRHYVYQRTFGPVFVYRPRAD